MSNSQNTLGSYETVGKPTYIGDLEHKSPTSVVEQITDLRSWENRVSLPTVSGELVVGRRAESDDYHRGFHLFHLPASEVGQGFSGVLAVDRRLRSDADPVAGFIPAGEGPDDEVIVEPVTELSVFNDSATEQLSELLPYIRTELTDSDWTGDGRSDTIYPEWMDAKAEMAKFYREEVPEDAPITFERKVFDLAKVMHALGRYPLDGSETLQNTMLAIERRFDDGIYESNPVVVRRLLLDYAAKNVDLSEVDSTPTVNLATQK